MSAGRPKSLAPALRIGALADAESTKGTYYAALLLDQSSSNFMGLFHLHFRTGLSSDLGDRRRHHHRLR